MKIKALLLAAATTIIAAASCKKEEIKPAPAALGSIKFTNTSDNPYNCYVDNEFMVKVLGKKSNSVTLIKGTYKIKVEQASGYVLYPTVIEKTISVGSGEEKVIVFP